MTRLKRVLKRLDNYKDIIYDWGYLYIIEPISIYIIKWCNSPDSLTRQEVELNTAIVSDEMNHLNHVIAASIIDESVITKSFKFKKGDLVKVHFTSTWHPIVGEDIFKYSHLIKPNSHYCMRENNQQHWIFTDKDILLYQRKKKPPSRFYKGF